MSSLTPEQRSIRASLAAHKRWAGDEDPKANALRAQAGLRAKFVRETQEKWPDLPEKEVQRRADHAYQAHMLSLALKSSRARTARKAAKSSGGDDHAA
jgi:hypothetical protein